jgi:hypothetical protein
MPVSDDDRDKALLDFALTRSCNAAVAANENSRPMAQAALLINGAAATAVIAFLTKDRIDPILFRAIPWSLLFYGLGVAKGAVSMFFMTEDLDLWNVYWENIARGVPQNEIDEQEAAADRWWWYAQLSFGLAILAFIVGSGILAWAIWHIPLPEPAVGGPG